MSKFVFFVFPSLVISQVHNLSGKILRFLDIFHKNDQTRTKKRVTIVALIMKVTSYFLSCLCFPLVLVAKFVHICLLAITRKIHALSGKTLKYLEQTQSNQTKDVTNSQGNGRHPNLYFYLNRIPFQPYGEYIDEILLKWYGNYELLFSHKWYIQWLFPNRDTSSNKYASVLTHYEAQKIKSIPETRKRVLTAFRMMLNFWGMELTQNYQFKDSPICHERWKVLNNHPFLAVYIMRILKAFKDLDLQQLNISWLAYLLDLMFRRKELCNLKSSFINSWVHILPESERRIMLSQCTSHRWN